jgi:hypothetical protein
MVYGVWCMAATERFSCSRCATWLVSEASFARPIMHDASRYRKPLWPQIMYVHACRPFSPRSLSGGDWWHWWHCHSLSTPILSQICPCPDYNASLLMKQRPTCSTLVVLDLTLVENRVCHAITANRLLASLLLLLLASIVGLVRRY